MPFNLTQEKSKCIAGTASKDHDSNPSFSCSDKSFSIDHVQVSTEEDQELEFIYGYKNGGSCRHIAPCSSSGSTIKNTQCGGADSVTVNVPKNAAKDTCNFGIHSVGFNCGSASVPVPSSTIVPVVSTYVQPPIYTYPANSTAVTPTAPSSYLTAPTGTAGCTTCSTIPIYSYSSPVFSYSSPIGTAPVSSYITSNSTSVPATYTASSPSVPASYPVSSGSSVVPTSPESTPSTPATYPGQSYPASSETSVVPTSPESSVPATYPASTPATYPASSPSSPATSPVQSYPASTPATYPASSPSSPATSPVQSYPASSPSSPATTPVQSYPVGSSSSPATYPVGSSSSPATYPVNSYPIESSTPVSSSLGNSPTEATSSYASETTPLVYTTEVTTVYTTTCPVTNTKTAGSSTIYETTTTVSTVTSTSVSTYTSVPVNTPEASIPATTPETPASTSGNSPVPVSSSSPVPSAPCPTVLPQCLNTWIKLTTCENNAASDCYCTNSEFTKNVQDCVSSWSYDDSEIQAALSYLAGICAPHVSANPGIITHVPKTITLVPTPATSSSPAVTPAPAGSSGVTAGPIGGQSTPAPAAGYQPATTISYSATLTVPVTYSTGVSAGSPIPSSSTTTVINTAVEVPQVQFTTGNSPAGATGAPSVGLAAGSPAPVVAASTPAAAGYGAAGATGTGASTFASVKQVPTAVSSPITPFEGAASKVGGGIVGVVAAGLISLLVLA